MKTRRCVMVSVLALLAACKQEAPEKKHEQPIFPVMEVDVGEIVVERRFPATLRGRQYVELRPQIRGVIQRVCMSEGSSVEKGQLLFMLDAAPYKAALAEAEARHTAAVAEVRQAESLLARAEADVSRYEKLADGGAVSQKKLDDARQEARSASAYLEAAQSRAVQAKAQVDKARADLSYTHIDSPVDGETSMVPWHVGALVSPDMERPLVTVADTGVVHAYFSLSESVWNTLSANGEFPPVEWLSSDGRLLRIPGRIEAASGVVDERTGCISIRAVFENRDGALKSGASGQVVIQDRINGHIVIPQAATLERQGQAYVWRVEQGEARLTPVQLDSRHNGRQFVVLGGLEPGNRIIADGAGLVKKGTLINNQSRKES